MKKLFASIVLLILFSVAGFAQTATYNTTLTAAVNATTLFIPVAATTNMLASTQQLTQILYCDGEEMQINSLNTTTKIATVKRGGSPTRATSHASGAICWFGPAGTTGPFTTTLAQGKVCTATSYPFLPLVIESTGVLQDCASGRWNTWNPNTQQANGYTPIADAAYTAVLADYIIAYTSLTAARTLTLPTPSVGITGKTYIIKNTSAGTSVYTIWISGTVDGVVGSSLFVSGTGYQVMRLLTNGVSWFKW